MPLLRLLLISLGIEEVVVAGAVDGVIVASLFR